MKQGIQKKIAVLFSLVFLFGVAATASAQISNPLGTVDPRIIIGNIINALLGIVGSLALAIFIFGGFTWVTSAGSEEKIKRGKDMVMWAAFGLVIIFISYALVTFVVNAISGASQNVAGTNGPSAAGTSGPSVNGN